ncbi:cytochrome ubiquinol oxidase subunit I [Roseospira marina]|uniref:Cytochrome ubiquinol oxidase subunit I n=1 Tax=Roseospira marina TaxID=140057 RepID=A0A5M6IG25_9PROT|nr:cytochrome ubiquinol oxidase subunit I [Roseospira marina]KAA5607203.1 cytochrome ubiquinol oxidase subunit I [Roseospira marina]MBB4312647.1 cytochrome d ubiquinol oxidase subunit I [Roseospira marina]MBB5085337.1 cytochrome d ubiquinol oxidase subunit I [Roseospira marina]
MLADIDPILLARIQFAFTVSFHILFPTLTIGLAWFLVTVEALWLRTHNPVYKSLYLFWAKLFALAFGMGVVSGLVLSYQFGTNFSRFSDATGPVLGPLLSVEVLTAFFVEAGFIGVMLFGWRKVGNRLHFLATILVSIGTINSAFWVLAANSWMHTPAGVEWIDGRAVVQDWWAVIFNPSMPYRVTHMVLASFLTGAFVVAAVSAWHLVRRHHEAVARKGLSLGLLLAAIVAPTQLLVGDQHGLNTLEHQPMKVAAMEGLWETERGAPLLLFALPDQDAQENHAEIGVPNVASLILTHDWTGEVRGLNEVDRADQPPVATVFFSFRIMVAIGLWMIALSALGVWLRWRGQLFSTPWLHWACILSGPSGFVATIAGWMVAEVGRQPYTVYGILRTTESASPVASGAVATSLVSFIVVYSGLLVAFLWYAARVVRAGPPAPDADDTPDVTPSRTPRAAVGADGVGKPAE